jgi:hypothetical protein
VVDLVERCGSNIGWCYLKTVAGFLATPRHTLGIIQKIESDKICWCGGTVWKGIATMQIGKKQLGEDLEDV